VAEIVTLAEAISATVHDGDTVAMEGFTHLIPHAAGHEVIRQHRRDLTLVRMTPGLPAQENTSFRAQPAPMSWS
jgi:glutaconate CoA-transferase, subunit A